MAYRRLKRRASAPKRRPKSKPSLSAKLTAYIERLERGRKQ